MKIEYGKSEHGHEFPIYNGELLSWSIGLYMTYSEEMADYPKAKTVIRAMQERRPEQLERERREMLKASFDRMFGHNAKKELDLIESLQPKCICQVQTPCPVHGFYSIWD